MSLCPDFALSTILCSVPNVPSEQRERLVGTNIQPFFLYFPANSRSPPLVTYILHHTKQNIKGPRVSRIPTILPAQELKNTGSSFCSPSPKNRSGNPAAGGTQAVMAGQERALIRNGPNGETESADAGGCMICLSFESVSLENPVILRCGHGHSLSLLPSLSLLFAAATAAVST